MHVYPDNELLRTQIAQLRQIALWACRLGVALAAGMLLLLGLGLRTSIVIELLMIACAIVIAALTVIALLTYRLLRLAVVVINILLCILGLLLLHDSLLTLPIVALYPTLMFLGTANFVPRSQLKWLTLFVIAISAILLGVYVALSNPIAQPELSLFLLVPSVLTTQAVIVIIAWQSQLHLWNMVTRAQQVQASLQNAHAHLEATVQARTAELQSTVSLLRATLDTTNDGILVIDSTRHVAVFNQVFATMWRIPEQLLVAGDETVLLNTTLDQVRDPDQFHARVQEIYADSECVSHDMVAFIDGRLVERTSQPQYIDGISIGRVWSFRDITQQVRAEQRMTAFASLSQQLSTATTVLDASRIIAQIADDLLGWDACFLNLYHASIDRIESIIDIDIIDGMRVEAAADATLRPVSVTARRIIANGAEMFSADAREISLLRPFGDVERLSESLMFVPIRHGALVVGILSIQSYTPHAYTHEDLLVLQGLADHCGRTLVRIHTQAELHLAEERQQILERKMFETQKLESLGVLTGGIAHDFNNLLAVIVGNADMARLDLEHAHPAFESIQQIEIAARRATELIRQMLSYAGKSQRLIQPIEINTLVLEMSNLLGASLPKHVRFVYELASQLPTLDGDATQLRQVVMNLLVNAADAIGAQPGLVHVRTGQRHLDRAYLDTLHFGAQLHEGIYVFVEVHDNGCGMDSMMIGKIFEPFFTTKFTGRGLGLAAVLGIVRSHDGAIAVESTPGAGTLFRILLPPTAASDPGALVPQPHAAALWRGTGTVLIIDDEPTVCRIAVRFVERCGFRTITASDGATGVDAFRAHRETLVAVLLDMTMPGMSGLQVLQEMHAIDAAIPVLLMSGYSEPNADHPGSLGLAVAFLHKPFQLEEVRAALCQATASPVPSRALHHG